MYKKANEQKGISYASMYLKSELSGLLDHNIHILLT